MSDGVITDVGQVDAGWLNRVLSRSGALATGGVVDFAVEPRENACSRSARIRLSYESGSTGALANTYSYDLANRLTSWTADVVKDVEAYLQKHAAFSAFLDDETTLAD